MSPLALKVKISFTFMSPLVEIYPKAPEAGLIPVPSPIQSTPPWNDAVPLALTLPIIWLVITICSNEPVPEDDISPLEEIYPNEPVDSIASTPPANEPVPLALTAPLISPLTAKWLNDPVPLELISPLAIILEPEIFPLEVIAKANIVPAAVISPLALIYPNDPVASIASIPPWKEPVPLALTAPLISPLTKKWLKDPVPAPLTKVSTFILITSNAEPEIPTPDNWLPSPIKAPLVLMSPLAVIDVKTSSLTLKLSIWIFCAIIVPLELISPDAVTPTACKCLHFLEVDPKSNVSFASGSILELTSATKPIESVSALPNFMEPLNSKSPATFKLSETVSEEDIKTFDPESGLIVFTNNVLIFYIVLY